MSFPSNTPPVIGAPSNGSDEGRHRRYPIKTVVAYRLRDGSAPYDGVGQTINISSRDVFFRADRVLPLRAKVDLRIDWPVSLDEALLSLVVYGVVTRSDETGTGVEIQKHEFRTRPAKVVA